MHPSLLKPLVIAALAVAPLSIAHKAAAQGVFVAPQITIGEKAPLRGPRANLARELRLFGFGGVDVRQLSNTQVARINDAVHSGRSRNHIRSLIQGALRPGLLQRGLNRISQ